MKRFVFAISGASGSPVALRVLGEILKTAEVHLIVSGQSFSILKAETGADFSGSTQDEIQRKARAHFGTDKLFFHEETNFHAPVSSGSFRTDGMLVVPCSMKTLAGIAHGYTNSLVERAADVTVKEGRKLLLCPREMPFSAIHIENMLRLARLGVVIAPPVMGFYHLPQNLDDMVDFVAGKVLDAMGVDSDLFRRWGTED